jgi:pimeloyl-[acyl-carrier protein] methyl ester esterase
MQFNWLNQHNNKTLILFFNGWGMNAGVVNSLSCTEFDVLEINDYTTISELPVLPEYDQTILIAWSLGVFTAAQCEIKSDLAIAINGTLRPIDETYGIPPVTFQATIDGWDERGRNKFNRRMCRDRKTLTYFTTTNQAWERRRPACNNTLLTTSNQQRLIEAQQMELIAIRDMVKHNPKPNNIFDIAIIGSGDRIMPPASQTAAWACEATDIIELGAPHYLFNRWNSWKELLDFAKNR